MIWRQSHQSYNLLGFAEWAELPFSKSGTVKQEQKVLVLKI